MGSCPQILCLGEFYAFPENCKRYPELNAGCVEGGKFEEEAFFKQEGT